MYPKSTANSKFFLYARKSSENEDRQVQSIDDQIRHLTELAKSYNLEIVEILTESKSAKKPYSRPVFTEMLKRIEKGNANGILCWQINRLSRNPIDSGNISWMLQQGVLKCIQTIEKQYLPDDNVLLFSVESGMANQYIIDLRKNCRRGMESKANKGWMPGCATIGYRNDKAEHIIIPDEERFDLVRQMWDLMLTGNYSVAKVRRIANEKWGFKTLKRKRMGGDELSNSVVYKFFRNVFYTGMFEWAGKLYPGNHKPMITMDEFNKVQALLGRKNNPRPKQHNAPYTGQIKCSTCGSMITSTTKLKTIKATGDVRTHSYYHCTRKKKLPVVCINPPIKEFDLEREIELELEKYTIAPEFLEWALQILENEKEQVKLDETSIKTMSQQSLAETQKEHQSLTQMRYRDLIDDEIYMQESKKLKDKMASLKFAIESNEDHTETFIELSEKAFTFACYSRKQFVNAVAEQKRDIFSAIGSNFILSDKKLLFTSSVWLVPIIEDYSEIYEDYKRLELDETIDNSTRNEELDALFLRWSAIVKKVRIAIKNKGDPNLFIPDLSKLPNPP